MNGIWVFATGEVNLWVGPAIVAAVVSGIVALVTVGLNSRQARKDRQHQVFAEAFAVCQAYKEFPFRVRRRQPGKEAAGDRARLTSELSDVQAKLNDFQAQLRVEAPRVGALYVQLVAGTRRIAGAEISRSWSLPAAEGDNVGIQDIDLSGLAPVEDQFLRGVADHLSLWPTTVAALWRQIRNRQAADQS